jgi:hypothetical protein
MALKLMVPRTGLCSPWRQCDQLSLDEGLAVFGDATFDVVLQIDTLQHLLRNARIMLRAKPPPGVASASSLSQFRPLAQPGRAARPHARDQVPYQWYDTVFASGTCRFRRALALQISEILDQFGLQDGYEIRFWPNTRASRAVFKFRGGRHLIANFRVLVSGHRDFSLPNLFKNRRLSVKRWQLIGYSVDTLCPSLFRSRLNLPVLPLKNWALARAVPMRLCFST